jgi:cytochrome c biogenesis protein CcdA
MGAQILFFPNFEIPMPRGITPKTGGVVGAFLLGALTGVIATPCAMPILVVVLSYVAAKGNVVYGGVLLFTYALGHSVLVLAAGSSMGLAEAMVNSKGLQKASVVLKKASGVLILLVAAYFLYDIFRY